MQRTSAVTRSSLPRSVVASIAVTAGLAFAACETVDLGDVPPDPGVCRPDRTYYETEIWPGYLTGGATSCVGQAGCHAEANGRSALRLDTSDPPDHARNYQVVTRFLNCSTPAASPLYTKPVSGEDVHGGGDLFAPGSTDATVFLGWFP